MKTLKYITDNWENGEVIGYISFISPSFLINQLQQQNSLVITRGRTEEFLDLNIDTNLFIDVLEHKEIHTRERFIIDTVGETTADSIIYTDINWLSQKGRETLLSPNPKYKIMICVQTVMDMEKYFPLLDGLVLGPSDNSLTNPETRFRDEAVYNLTQDLKYHLDVAIEYRFIDQCDVIHDIKCALQRDSL